jgi:lysophospholipase L1-like esterase
MPPHVASLGSSFAAGPRIPPQIGPKAASRSANNYAHLLAEKLNATLTDMTISGATLKTIADEPQIARGQTFAPQIEGLSEDIDIVTITAGGNDLNYVGDMLLDTANNYIVGSWILRMYSYFFPALAKDVMEEEQLTTLYISILDKIHCKSPKARVFLVQYLTLLGPHVRPQVDVPLSTKQIRYHSEVAEKLQRATAKAADARQEWCECLSVHQASQQHGIGSAEPWVEGFGLGLLVRGVAPYHPNAAGMNAVSSMLYEKLKN